MSAYIVSKAHVDVLVRALWDAGLVSPKERDAHGQSLLDENVRSVNDRYPSDSDLPGTYEPDGTPEWASPYHFRLHVRCASVVEVIKAIHCYRYQSCEHEGWEASDAQQITRELSDNLIRELPGYRAAPWSWDSELLAKHTRES